MEFFNYKAPPSLTEVEEDHYDYYQWKKKKDAKGPRSKYPENYVKMNKGIAGYNLSDLGKSAAKYYFPGGKGGPFKPEIALSKPAVKGDYKVWGENLGSMLNARQIIRRADGTDYARKKGLNYNHLMNEATAKYFGTRKYKDRYKNIRYARLKPGTSSSAIKAYMQRLVYKKTGFVPNVSQDVVMYVKGVAYHAMAMAMKGICHHYISMENGRKNYRKTIGRHHVNAFHITHGAARGLRMADYTTYAYDEPYAGDEVPSKKERPILARWEAAGYALPKIRGPAKPKKMARWVRWGVGYRNLNGKDPLRVFTPKQFELFRRRAKYPVIIEDPDTDGSSSDMSASSDSYASIDDDIL